MPAIQVEIIDFPTPRSASTKFDSLSGPGGKQEAATSPIVSGPGTAAVAKVFHQYAGTTLDTNKIRNVREGAPFRLRAYLATVDLARIGKVLVSSNRTHPTSPVVEKEDTGWSEEHPMKLVTTPAWADYVATDLAINANFFDIGGGGKVHLEQWTRVNGLSLSDGTLDEEPLPGNGADKGTTSLLFRRDRRAELREDYAAVKGAMRKVARSSSALNSDEYLNGVAGTRLLRDGELNAAGIGPDPDMRHARTVVGVVDDGWTLVIMMYELQTEIARSNEYQLYSTDDPAQRNSIELVLRQLGKQTKESGVPASLRELPLNQGDPQAVLKFVNQMPVDFGYRQWTLDTTVTAKDGSRWLLEEQGSDRQIVLHLLNLNGIPGVKLYDLSGPVRTAGDDYSVGVTLPEAADVLKCLGVENAVNLDGSGSSALIYTPHSKAPANWIYSQFHDRVSPDDASGETPETDPGVEKSGKFSWPWQKKPESVPLKHLELYLAPRPAGNHLGFKE